MRFVRVVIGLALLSSQTHAQASNFGSWRVASENGACVMARMDKMGEAVSAKIFIHKENGEFFLQISKTDWNLSYKAYTKLEFISGSEKSRYLGMLSGIAEGKDIIIKIDFLTMAWLMDYSGEMSTLYSDGKFIDSFQIKPDIKSYNAFITCLQKRKQSNPSDPFSE